MIGWYRVLVQVAIFLGRVGRQAYAALIGHLVESTLNNAKPKNFCFSVGGTVSQTTVHKVCLFILSRL